MPRSSTGWRIRTYVGTGPGRFSTRWHGSWSSQALDEAGQHLLDALEGPVELLGADRQRWRDAQRGLVRVLCQHAALHEPLAGPPRREGLVDQLDPEPQAALTHLAHGRMASGSQPG